MKIDAIVEGGMLRAVYVDGELVDHSTFDFDVLDGGSEYELDQLLEDIDAAPHGTKLHLDLLTWRPGVEAGLETIRRLGT